MKTILEKNRIYSDRYTQEIDKKQKVPEIIKEIVKDSKNILDLGCGYGQMIYSILLENPKKKVTGVDISDVRIKTLKNNLKGEFICGDVSKTKLKSNSYDLIISTQVIEHLKSDKQFVSEIKRLLKKQGCLYITSVIKKPWAVYKYRNNGKFVLDPTHEKEYKDKKEFLGLFKGLKLIKGKITPVRRKFLFFELNIPGYYIIETLWKKK